MDAYLVVKTLHILSAAVLFGTGLGIASFMFLGHRDGQPAARAFAARTTVKADFFFTLPAVIVQPLTGVLLIAKGGFAWTEAWLVLSYGLYLFAGLCWIPVVVMQMRIKTMLEAAEQGLPFDREAYGRLYRRWFALGWPAFLSVIAMFWLMVAKPQW